MLLGSMTARRGFFGARPPMGLGGAGLVEGDGVMPPVPGNHPQLPVPMFQPGAGGASAIGWDEGATQTLPALPPPGLPSVRSQGIFGTSQSAQPDGAFPAVSAMGERLASNGFPGRPVGQSFDYDGALASMLPQRKKRSTLEKIASVAIPALMGFAGNQAGANAFVQNQVTQRNQRQRQSDEAKEMIARWKYQDYARQDVANLRASAPRVIGRSMVQYDPNSGGVNELYDGPEDFESYAETMGLEPGTQEYFDAVEDYVLKSDGPTAYEHDKGLDDYRTGNRLRIEGARQGNRESLEGIRQRNRVTTRGLPTYRDANPRAGGRGGGTAKPRAFNEKTGETYEYDGNAWVPVR